MTAPAAEPIWRLWHAAAALAARRHEGQRRKDDATPYFVHTARVALVIAARFGIDDDEVLAAAYLHDTIEDTDTDYDDIAERFGRPVADLVVALTKDMRLPEDLREPAYDAALARADWRARLIKLADVYDNLLDVAPTERAKMRGKVERALALASDDAELAGPRAALVELAGRLGVGPVS